MTHLFAFDIVVGFPEMTSFISFLSCLAHLQLTQVLCQRSASLQIKSFPNESQHSYFTWSNVPSLHLFRCISIVSLQVLPLLDCDFLRHRLYIIFLTPEPHTMPSPCLLISCGLDYFMAVISNRLN